MKHAAIAFIAFGFLAASYGIPAIAQEAETYYLEIGGDFAQGDAEKTWDALVAKHKSLLSGLKMFPKAVMENGQVVNTRIQAGPVASKPKAQRICNRLFASNMPCFVIEGLNQAAITTSSLNAGAGQPTTFGSAPLVKETAPLPWVMKTPEPAQDASENKEADVHVAEAIRVPLSEDTVSQAPPQQQVQIRTLPPIAPLPQASNEKLDVEPDAGGAGWLSVASFPDEDIAVAFWEEVRAAAPVKAKSLRVRILRPLMLGQKDTTSLNIGPFANSGDAYEFCHEDIQARDRGLTCSFGSKEPGIDLQAPGRYSPHSRSEAYEMRRTELTRRRLAENPPLQQDEFRQYWVQIASAATQAEAMKMHDEIREKNGDLLEGTRSSISASAEEKRFVVRVGPIQSNNTAVNLCGKLQERNVKCRVILFTGGQ